MQSNGACCASTCGQGAPLAVVYCYCEADVVAAMQWATALPGQPAVTARAGRHSYEGFSVSNATIVIDVSNFTTARVDEATNTAVFGAGVKLIDVCTWYCRRVAQTEPHMRFVAVAVQMT